MSFIFIQVKRKPRDSTLQLSPLPDQFVLSNQSGSIYASLHKRTAYPVTFCERQGADTFVLGYGDRKKRPGYEFLEIRLSKSGTLSIARDRFAALPLFYALTGEDLIICNEYPALLAAHPEPMLSHSRLLELLAAKWSHMPLAHDVHYLRHGEKLHFENGRLRIIWPPDRDWLVSEEVPDSEPRLFYKKLNGHFNFFIETRLKAQHTVFEVSSGLDSATLPQYYALLYQKPITCSTIYYSPEEHTPQRRKLRAFIEATSAEAMALEPNHLEDFPFSEFISTGRYEPHHHGYGGTISYKYLDMLQSRGTEVLVSGMGGDETFSHLIDREQFVEHGVVERERRRAQPMPPFFTQAFKEAYLEATPDEAFQAIPLVQNSVAIQQVGNSPSIERGIWPVTPFDDPDLTTWCNGLKNILRAYHRSLGFVPEIYTPAKDEEIGDYLTRGFQNGGYDEIMQHLLNSAVTVQLGYVNADELLRMYYRLKSEAYPGMLKDQFSIFRWLSAEINAQHSGFHDIT